MTRALCFKCKIPQDVKDPVESETKNHRMRVSGICSVCGASVSSFTKKKAANVEETNIPALLEPQTAAQ